MNWIGVRSVGGLTGLSGVGCGTIEVVPLTPESIGIPVKLVVVIPQGLTVTLPVVILNVGIVELLVVMLYGGKPEKVPLVTVVFRGVLLLGTE